jgi:uncharacterized protein (DUF1330 family)
MPSYCQFDNLRIHDPQKLARYKDLVAPIVTKFGGRYVVLGGRVEVLEGAWRPNFPVMIEFPTLPQAQDWYRSEEYRDLKAMRLAAGSFNAILIEGIR